MQDLTFEESNMVFGSKIIMLASKDSMMYIVTGDDRFKYDAETTLTSSMMFINDKPCPDVFTDKGAQSNLCIFKAYPIEGGTRYVKVV